jgi:hypothetical protein
VSPLTTIYKAHVFEDVCAAVERCTIVRKRLGSRLLADCPVCGRRRRLCVTDKPDRVLICCNAGCDKDAVRERMGLPWAAFFKERRVREPSRLSAEAHVLNAIRRDRRWSLLPHRKARYEVRRLLHTRDGELIAWDEFPVTAVFIQKALAKLGIRIGLKHAYRVRRVMTGTSDHPGLLDSSYVFNRKDGSGKPGYAIWKFSLQARAQAVKALLGQAPATTSLLSAGRSLSRVDLDSLVAQEQLLRPQTTGTRGPPEQSVRPTRGRSIDSSGEATPATEAERLWCPTCDEPKRTIRKPAYPGLV